MKRILVAGAAILVSCSLSAMAADMPVKAPPAAPAPAAPTTDWTGLYVGGHVGFMDVTDNISDLDKLNGGANYQINDNTAVAGAQIGYNFQWNWFVIGVEADWSSIYLNGFRFDQNFPGGTYNRLTGNDMWDVTGRAGFAWNGLFLYFKGGGVWTNINAYADNHLGGFGQIAPGSTGHFNGTILGGGAEWMIFPNWSVKLEYQNLDLGSQNATIHTVTSGFFRYSNSLHSENLWTVGVNYHFTGLWPSNWTWH